MTTEGIGVFPNQIGALARIGHRTSRGAVLWHMSQPAAALSADDQRLLELVTAALTDPNLHTDARMRISAQLTELLQATHHELRGSSRPPAGPLTAPGHGDERHPVDLLGDVLVDPNLHTDLRLQLHERIDELLQRGG